MPTLFTTGQTAELAELANQVIPLVSSMIESIEYDPDTQDLDITFTSGKTYTLSGVGPDLFLGLAHSSSPGRYYNDNLKGKY